MRSRWFRSCAVIVVVAVATVYANGTVFAEDRLVLRLPGSSSRVAVRGQVLDVSGDAVEFRLAVNKEVKRYPLERVVEIITPRVPQHARAVSSIGQRQYGEAVTALQAALEADGRPWMRHTILADLIRCYIELGDDVAAAERFILLVRSDPRPRNWILAPLRWTNAPVTEAERQFVDEALRRGGPVARLIAASWVLEQPGLAGTAGQVLDELLQAQDEHVRTLARVQLWRRDVQSGAVSDLRIARWEREVRRMPLPLRRGPMLVLAAARRGRRENDLAAATWLWLPSAFPEPRRWAAEAVFEAAEALRDAGDIKAAARLFDEVASEYPDAPASQLAAGALDELRRRAAPTPQGRGENGK